MNEGTLAFAGSIGDPLQAAIDDSAGRGAAAFEIVGELLKGRDVQHSAFPPSWPGRALA
jgi:hypothetical protein